MSVPSHIRQVSTYRSMRLARYNFPDALRGSMFLLLSALVFSVTISTSLPPHTIRRIPLRIRLHRLLCIWRIGLSGYNFAYFNNQFVLVGVLPVRSFVIVLTERSDCLLVEQIMSISAPPGSKPRYDRHSLIGFSVLRPIRLIEKFHSAPLSPYSP